MSKKLFSLIVLTALVLTLLPAAGLAAPPPQGEGQVYTVQKDDWLSKLADKEYGNVLAYPAIVHYNNLQAETDSSLALIEDPDLIEVGWSIYLPTPEEAEAFLAPMLEEVPSSTAGLTPIGGQINVLGWEGYDYPDAFEAFYDVTGVVPNATYIGNNDEIISKFKAGGPGVYDVGNINSRYFVAMAKQGMLVPLDESRLPNLQYLFPAWDEEEFGIYEGQRYAVPGFFGPSGLCYRADLVPEPTWDFYMDPAYQGKYAVTTNPLASMYVWGMDIGKGQDATQWTLDDLEEIKARGMEEWKYAATTAGSTGEQVDLLVRGDVVLTTDCWEAVPAAAQEQGVDVKMTVPPGPKKVWVDVYFIFDVAQNVDAAYGWINHAISQEGAAIMADYLNVAVSNQRAFDLLSDELKERVGYDTLNSTLKTAEFNVLPDPDATAPNVALDDLYKAFDEIQASVE